MKKVSLLFVVAVLLPSLVLAWLAVRSLRDQQFLLERQQSLLCQRATDSLAQQISDALAQRQQEFAAQVETIVGDHDPRGIGAQFDSQIRQRWPLAEVGFCVTLTGKILSPLPTAREEAKRFYSDNGSFLGNREAVEVYNNVTAANAPASSSYDYASRGGANAGRFTRNSFAGSQGQIQEQQTFASANLPVSSSAPSQMDVASEALTEKSLKKDQAPQPPAVSQNNPTVQPSGQNIVVNYKSAQQRKVMPQQNAYFQAGDALKETAEDQNLSRVVPAEGEFRQLIGEGTDGMFARFLQNKLRLMVWHRLQRNPDYVFGAQLDLNRVVENLRPLVQPERALENDLCLALLDDNAKPVVISRAKFQANWKRPFVATEIGEALPHWEIAAYLVDPARLTQAARTARLTLGLLVALLVFAIGIGSWLVVRSLNAELKLARQKTDFVSNVSHELKTPLTSIRMFSELLAEGRVADQAKQHSYLNIITAEAARLTRLINNVLDFSRMERGEKKYHFQACDITEIARATAETFRPHLEAGGFKFTAELPEAQIPIHGDADALSQVLVNLLSNAEKYSNGAEASPSPRPSGERVGVRGGEKNDLFTPALSSVGGGEEGKVARKEISLTLAQRQSPLPHVEIRVLDRGSGVPRGCEEKIFEKFYRAHDSLSNGIQGSGLGLTIARQIARAHGGDIVCESRDGGGSCFILRLPISIPEGHG